MIFYLVGKDVDSMVQAMVRDRGWTRIGWNRCATPEKDDVRAIRQFHDMIPIPGGTQIVRGLGFAENPQAALFRGEVEAGRAAWRE